MEASNWGFVSAAYVITWALIAGYMAYSQRALNAARAEYKRVTGRRPGEGEAV
jgi:CcmD family protein